MKSRVPMFAALGLTTVLGALAYAGCSSSSTPGTTPTPDSSVQSECTDISAPAPLTNAGCENEPPAKDRCNPPGKCSPVDVFDSKCTKGFPTGCPSDTACMAQTKQTGDVLNYRMGRIKLWAPASLLALESIAVTPFVNPSCVDSTSGEGFSWLMQLDRTKNTLTTGGARKSADHKNFAFLAGEKVDPSTLDALCPGFGQAGAAAVPLDPMTVAVTWSGNTFSTQMVPQINIPIFDTDVATNPPVILPLKEAFMKNVTISSDKNCIGAWDKDYFCGSSQGWTTDGVLVGKITSDDADKVPIKKVGCQSLCALLVNDSSKTDDTGHCKKGADGKVITGIGDACVGGTGCNNAFALSATFGAYGVTVPTFTPGGDAGPTDAAAETGSETGTDAGTDAADAASETATDAASGG